MQTEVQICFIEEYPSLMEGILQICSCSKNKIKKYSIKSKLALPVKRRTVHSISLNIVNDGRISPNYSGHEVTLISEDELFTVVSKPVETHCHPLSYCEHDNVLSALLNKNLNRSIKVNPSKYDRGLLYRLDFETSGLLLLANTGEVYEEIRSNFHTVIKEKYYLAAVHGKLKGSIKLNHYLKPFGTGRKKIVVCEHSDMPAECHIEFVEYNQEIDASLVKVRLVQGHRHQIRVQLSSIGHPILGDDLYRDSDSDSDSDRENNLFKRLFLHCWKYNLEFKGKNYEFQDSKLGLFFDFFNFNG